ncbi:hypothetical protein IJJ39_02625, partial [Candidatus Saccharibacteria bacterium]|nr:hypothetical protein [Candidatus Saccharibacteria bacterium]
PNVNNTIIVYDKRDEQPYKIAKLADGKYWMVENLNLAGGTTITSADSDVTEDFTLPQSSETGFNDNTKADGYVYNTGKRTSDCTNGCYSYYSYNAATAGTGASLTENGVNASGSICPKGWRLPTSTTSNASATSNNNWKTGDFYALATAYGANLESNYYVDSATFYNNAGPGTTPNFLLTGDYENSTLNYGGSAGFYWLSTSKSGTAAYFLYFNSGFVNSAGDSLRKNGFSVRCIANS